MLTLTGYLVVPIMDVRPGMVRTDGATVTTLPVREQGRVTFQTTEGKRWGMPRQSVLMYNTRA